MGTAHAESMGTTCRAVIALAHSLQLDLESHTNRCFPVLVGMDSNVKVTNKGAAATPESLGEIAAWLGFLWASADNLLLAGTDTPATHTVLKTRGFLQTQLGGKAGVPDQNLKDWMFYLPPVCKRNSFSLPTPVLQGRVVNKVGPKWVEGRYEP